VIQVIGNLLGNALKFSPSGSALQLSLRHEEKLPDGLPGAWRVRLAGPQREKGYAVVSVADNGPGVPAEEKAKIFDKFHQVRRAGKRPGQGTGLGLAICRTITEAHNGAIWVEDNPDGGSVFRLLLPAENPAESKVPQPAPRASAPI
jgi:signal transduction histidine kinase